MNNRFISNYQLIFVLLAFKTDYILPCVYENNKIKNHVYKYSIGVILWQMNE